MGNECKLGVGYELRQLMIGSVTETNIIFQSPPKVFWELVLWELTSEQMFL